MDIPSLAEALKWMDFMEGVSGPLSPITRASTLAALYEEIHRAGGLISPERASEIIAGARGDG